MKKILVALVALSTVSAFAGDSMVRLDDCFNGQCESADFSMTSDDVKNSEKSGMNIQLNYAYNFGMVGLGATLGQSTLTRDGDVKSGDLSDNTSTLGLSAYWNQAGTWDNTCFAALHYTTVTTGESDDVKNDDKVNTTIALEYGHRFLLGNLMGLNWNWSPSVTYSMNTMAPNTGKDVASTDLMLNVANVAVTF